MDEEEVRELARALSGVAVEVADEASGAPEVAWGDTFIFYDPSADLGPDRRFPFATIVTKDYPGFDEASELDRPGVFRLNLWVGKDRLGELVGDGSDGLDPAELDSVVPHPQYGAQGWVAIVGPGPRTAELARSLLVEAHARAVERHERRSA